MSPKQNSNIPWWAIVLGFMTFPPIGFILLFLSIAGVQIPRGSNKNVDWSSYRRQSGTTGTYRAPDGRTTTFQHGTAQGSAAQGGTIYTGQVRPGAQQANGAAQAQRTTPPPQAAPKKTKKKSRFKIRGNGLAGVLSATGMGMSFVSLIGLVDELSFALEYGLLRHMSDWFPWFGFLCAGIFTAGTGIAMSRKQKRLRLYLGVIGTRQSVFISDLASTAGVSEKKVIGDLQDFLADGTFPPGYIDRASGRLVFTDQGYASPEPEVKKEAPKKAEEPKKEDPDDALLRQIREVNDAIADEMMSRKIDRIGEITGRILDYQRRNPAKAPELRQFLNYYLPTTLKILNAYAQMEAQGVEGENISTAKDRIEGMMDKVVEGFEKQLDQLFRTDAMDITTDVEVLERMLDKDGLGSGMTMGG